MYLVTLMYRENNDQEEFNFSCHSYSKIYKADKGMKLLFAGEDEESIREIETWKDDSFYACYIMNQGGDTIDKFKKI